VFESRRGYSSTSPQSIRPGFRETLFAGRLFRNRVNIMNSRVNSMTHDLFCAAAELAV